MLGLLNFLTYRVFVQNPVQGKWKKYNHKKLCRTKLKIWLEVTTGKYHDLNEKLSIGLKSFFVAILCVIFSKR